MERFLWDLKAAIVEKFGTQVEASKALGIREAKLSYIIRGHAQPSDQEFKALEHNLGRKFVKCLRIRTRMSGVNA